MSIEVGEIVRRRSQDRPQQVRLAAVVNSSEARREEFWFDFPRSYADDLSTTFDPWLVLLLPLAAATGEELVLPGEVDGRLLSNCRRLAGIWNYWYSWTGRAKIRVAEADSPPPDATGETAIFFSGGVDSFFSLLRNEKEISGPYPTETTHIDDLVTIFGFDIPLGSDKAGRDLFQSSDAVADALGKNVLPVTTNLRETNWYRRVPWEKLGYGAALATCVHLLDARYRRALVPAGSGYRRMSPRGFHPLTSRFMASTSLTITHDGAAVNRVDKTRAIAPSPLAQEHLRVCWRSGSARNCAGCEKCYRTMLTLHLVGHLSEFETFDRSRLRHSSIPRILAKKESDAIFLSQVENLARDRDEKEIAVKIRAALRRSRFKRQVLDLADLLGGVRGLWRIGRRLRRLVFARSIA